MSTGVPIFAYRCNIKRGKLDEQKKAAFSASDDKQVLLLINLLKQ
jgi:hypothetical protein